MDEYAKIMEKMLADNAAAAEALVAGAGTGQAAAAAELQSARQAWQETEKNAAQLLQEYTDRHQVRLEQELRETVIKELAQQLLGKHQPITEVADLLDVSADTIHALVPRFRRREPGSIDAWLGYEESGRSGYVIFQQGATVCRFSYEFGGGRALAIIDIPTAAQWEAQTGLPLAERETVLEFIGAQVVADKAPDYQYRIDDQSIVIFI